MSRPPLSDQELDLLAHCSASLKVQAKILHPHLFEREFDKPYDLIFNQLDRVDIRHNVFGAPRGIGKTTIANTLFAANRILFGKSRYIVLVSNSNTLATQQSENLKAELLGNEIIRKWFGDVKTDNFSKEQWVVRVAGYEVCVMPRGMGQQVRGLLYKGVRPDCIIIDDLETKEGVRSEDRRKADKEWFKGDLLNCVDRAKYYRYVYLDTLKHEDSQLADLLEKPLWNPVRIELCDDNRKSYFPNFMSDEDIEELYQQHVEDNQVGLFYQEFRCLSNPMGDDAPFQSRFFKYYEEDQENLKDNPDVENILLVDPARTTNLKSAESALVVVGVNMVTHKIYVRDIISDKLHPHELYDNIAGLVMLYNVGVIGIDTEGLHEFVLHPLKNHLAKEKIEVEIMEMINRLGQTEDAKRARVKKLADYYRPGLIYHNKTVCGALEAQLLSFPNSRRWDIMDALAYFPQVLERGERYMRPYTGKTPTRQEAERDFQVLMRQMADRFEPLPDWRSI